MQAVASVMRDLVEVWCRFEGDLAMVPIIRRLESRRFRREDYRSLLVNIRQQVVDGSCWIARAASNIGPEAIELRTLFLRHAVDEHRDFLLIEEDHRSVGGSDAEIRSMHKNIGSEAFSAWMFTAASRPNPFPLLGAMSIIEGLGARKAGAWAAAIRSQLGSSVTTRFLDHHAQHDSEEDGHMQSFARALELAMAAGCDGQEIVRHARIAARLYRLQLEEIEHAGAQ